jgi:hypothetical protein
MFGRKTKAFLGDQQLNMNEAAVASHTATDIPFFSISKIEFPTQSRKVKRQRDKVFGIRRMFQRSFRTQKILYFKKHNHNVSVA